MRDRSIIDSIDYYKSAVYLSIYRGGGWTLYKLIFRANSANLANNRSTRLGTLIYSAHARTVRPTGADRPAHRRGPSEPRTVRPQDRTIRKAQFGSKQQANEGEPHRGLVVGQRTVRRDRCAGYMRLMSDYFVHTPVYSEDIFRRR